MIVTTALISALKSIVVIRIHNIRALACLAVLLSGTISTVHAEPGDRIAELDAFWAEVSRSAAEGDFAAYAATYHPDAVLVSKNRGASVPIANALARWQPGFDDTKAGKTTASVEFRFTQRLNDAATAHETGIFHYTSKPLQGDGADEYIHFEALLVNRDGWKMIMEYQKDTATRAEWDAAR